MAVMIQGSIIVLAKAMGPFEVVIFSTMRTIANVVSRFLAMISHSAWPEFTRLYINQESKRLQALFQSILFVSTLAGLLYLGAVQFFGSKVFDLWVGGRLPYETLVMLMMAVLVVLTNQWTLGGNLLMATNRHREYARVQLPVNITALGIAYLGACWLGLEGFIGGLILGQSVPMIILTVRSFRRNFWWDASRSVILQTLLVLMLLPLYLHHWGVTLIVVGVSLFGVYALRGKLHK
jgi:O-antigen/teichoic acid export membrane protein